MRFRKRRRVDFGCDYCRDDQNRLFGHVTQVASNEELGTILLQCPRCEALYENTPRGKDSTRRLTATEALQLFPDFGGRRIGLMEQIAEEAPGDVHRSGSEIFVHAMLGNEVVDRAESLGIPILGIEGFLIDEPTGSNFPSLGRIADFSRTVEPDREEFVKRTCAEARNTLVKWSNPPTPRPGVMNADAKGRHMLSFVLGADDA